MNLVLVFWTDGEEKPAHRGSMTEVNYIDQAGGIRAGSGLCWLKKGIRRVLQKMA